MKVLNDNNDEIFEIEKSELEKKLKDNQLKHNKLLDYCDSNEEIVYAIATVSDKPINRRIYPDQFVRETVEDRLWTTPYSRPFLINHDTKVEPLGRVYSQSLYSHKDKKITLGDEIPEEVVKAFEDRKLFKEGTSSVILGIKTSNWYIQYIKDGTYLTVSQGSGTDEITCNICGKPLSECEHIPGQKYDDKTCLAVTGKLFPYEISVVNEPANDTSIMIVYDPTSKNISSFNDIKNQKKINKKTKDETEETIITDSLDDKKGEFKKMNLEKLAISIFKMQKDKLIKSFKASEEEIEKITKDFDLSNLYEFTSLTDLLIEKSKSLIDEITKDFTEKENQLKDEISKLENKIADLEVKQIDLTDEEVVEEKPIEEKPVEEEKVEGKDLTDKNQIGKIEDEEKIPNFTDVETKKKENDSIISKFFNKKSIADTF